MTTRSNLTVFALALLLSAGFQILGTDAGAAPAISSGTRAVVYVTYPADGERRCAGQERIGYRVNPECCPKGFSVVGVRMNDSVGDAVCVQD